MNLRYAYKGIPKRFHTELVMKCVLNFVIYSSPPLELAALFYMRGQSCQWSLKWYFFSPYWWFCRLSPCFHLCGLWRDNL